MSGEMMDFKKIIKILRIKMMEKEGLLW